MTTNLPHSRPQEVLLFLGSAAIFHLVEKSDCPGRSRQYLLAPWSRPKRNFSSSRSRPGPGTDVCGSHYPKGEDNRGGCTGPVSHPVEHESDC